MGIFAKIKMELFDTIVWGTIDAELLDELE